MNNSTAVSYGTGRSSWSTNIGKPAGGEDRGGNGHHRGNGASGSAGSVVVPSLSLLESDPLYAPPGGVVQEYRQAGWTQDRSRIVCSSSIDGNCCSAKALPSGTSSPREGSKPCCRWYDGYFFASKALVLVLLVNALFSTALYGVTSEVLKLVIGPEFVLVRNLTIHGITQILFPVAGHLADCYVGKYNVIRFSLWTGWVGFAVMGIFFSLETFNDHISILNQYFIMPIVFMLLSVSYICFTATVIPFGMDQLQGASHVHFRSFFCWWYWTWNVGVILVNVPQYCQTRTELGVTIQAEIGVVCLSAALILDALFKHWFVIEPKSSKNPIRQIVRVLREVRSGKKTTHWIPSSVRHELDLRQLSRLDLMKKRYGGKYEAEEVEDVCMFFRIMLVLCSVGLPIFSYAGVFGSVGVMAGHMDLSLVTMKTKTEVCDIEVTIADSISAILILTLIPLLDLLLVPMLRNCYATILKRLGAGATLAFLSIVVLFLFEAFGSHTSSAGEEICMLRSSEQGQLHINVYWILLPLVMVTLAEIFIYIPSFEFVCAQAPYNMRCLLIGLFFSVQGTFSLLSVLLQYLFSWARVSTHPFQEITGYTCAFWYYLIYVVVCFLGLLLYFLAAYRYRRRQRDEVFNDMRMIEDFFQTGAVAYPFP